MTMNQQIQLLLLHADNVVMILTNPLSVQKDVLHVQREDDNHIIHRARH